MGCGGNNHMLGVLAAHWCEGTPGPSTTQPTRPTVGCCGWTGGTKSAV